MTMDYEKWLEAWLKNVRAEPFTQNVAVLGDFFADHAMDIPAAAIALQPEGLLWQDWDHTGRLWTEKHKAALANIYGPDVPDLERLPLQYIGGVPSHLDISNLSRELRRIIFDRESSSVSKPLSDFIARYPVMVRFDPGDAIAQDWISSQGTGLFGIDISQVGRAAAGFAPQPQLKALVCAAWDNNCAVVFRALQDLQHLQVVDRSSNLRLLGLPGYVQSVGATLRSLDISIPGSQPEGAGTDLSSLQNIAGLERLNMQGREGAMTELLAKNKNFTHLNLSLNAEYPAGYFSLDWLEGQEKLAHLELSGRSIMGEEGFMAAKNLCTLNISYTDIMDITCLRHTSLHALNLTGAVALPQYGYTRLPELQWLQTLFLRENDILEDVGFLQEMPRLRNLEVDDQHLPAVSAILKKGDTLPRGAGYLQELQWLNGHEVTHERAQGLGAVRRESKSGKQSHSSPDRAP